MADDPIKVAVLGSCISRDSFNSKFNPDYKQFYDCTLIQNQTSIISLMSEPLALTDEQYGQMSDYDKWNVRSDTSKEFLDLVVEHAPDYLILDFFGDVHFGCLEIADGQFITNNRWKLWPTSYYKQLKKDGLLRELRMDRDLDRYLEIWKESYDRLVEYLRKTLPDTTFIVHRGHNTDTLLVPEKNKKMRLTGNRPLFKTDAARLNELWSMLDDYATESTGFESIDLTMNEYPTFDDHPWGPFYVHYELGYYHDFLAALHRIHLKHRLSGQGDTLAIQMVNDLERLADTRTRPELDRRAATIARQRARIKSQADRIRSLEREPVVVSVKRSLRRAARRIRR